MIGLIFTLLLGSFFIIGSLIVFISKNNNKFVHISMSIAFGVIISLIALELLPESWEIISENYSFLVSILLIIGFMALGILVLKFLDTLLPEHHTDHDDKESLYHIGIISAIALILHNVIEGMAVYSAVASDINLGLMLSLGVGLHNIPMGMVITSTLYGTNKSKKKTIMYIILISLSTFLGGFLMHMNLNLLENPAILGILLSLTDGMLIYIALFELLPHLFHSKNHKSIYWVLVGILIMIISTLLG